MTNSIGKGITMVSVPMTDEEALIYGKLALTANKSRSAFIREMMVFGLMKVQPEEAKQVLEIRKARAILTGSIGLALLTFARVFMDDTEVRRARSEVRIYVKHVRNLRGKENV